MRIIGLFVAFALALGAQSPAFEAASIKVNNSGEGRSSIQGSAGRVVMENVSLKKLTLWAYGIPDDRDYALEGPDWLSSEHFDVQATFGPNATPDLVRQMAQTLLADRFKLALHKETREKPILALVVGKNGVKIHAESDGVSRTSARAGRLEATHIGMPKLADLLQRLTGQVVVDATGLPGMFSFVLEWSPDDTKGIPPADDTGAKDTAGPSLYSAVQEQLGLKLESRKAPVEVLVVDRMEKMPTSN
jgi:uncharacterized protein (TIGR03435 family)